MTTLPTIARAALLSLGMAGLALGPLGVATSTVALAQDADPAADTAFIQSLGQRMVAVVNGPGDNTEKKAQLQPMLRQDVDIDYIARACLGRFWRTATPDQQQRYLALFRQVLTNAIDDKLGEYRGVGITVGRATVQDGKSYVSTVITRPGQPTANVQWVVSHAGGGPKIDDVVIEGISLSVTQRSDYASYLAHNGNNVDALLNALQSKVGRQS